MGTVIYSTSPLGTFLSTFLQIGFILLIGVVGLAWAVFNRKQGKGARIAMGIAGLFLCAAGALAIGYTALNMMTSTQTATVFLKQKTVAQQAFDGVEEGGCYEVSYYPKQGLFATDYGTDLYIATPYVTRIMQAEQGDCK